MRVVAIVQARLASSRFPRKVLADLRGRTVLEHVVQRARWIAGVDRVIVAVPATERELADFCLDRRIAVVVGDPTDVLRRFHTVAQVERLAPSDAIIRLTGDTPLLDPEEGARVLALWRACEGDDVLADNKAASAGPGPDPTDGTDVEVFSCGLLERAHQSASTSWDREHVTSWMHRHVRAVHRVSPGPPVKLSVDTPEDLERVAAVMALLPAGETRWSETVKAAIKLERRRAAAAEVKSR